MKHYTMGGLALAAGAAVMVTGLAQQEPPFGGSDDTEYADGLWETLLDARFVGDDRIRTMPYEGVMPHGAILEYIEQELEVSGHRGLAIVKINYMSEDMDREAVLREPAAHLDGYTVMFQRESDYDPDHQNWFWAKYEPDGSLDTAPNGMQMAGRVPGCIECHGEASGGDYIFAYDREP